MDQTVYRPFNDNQKPPVGCGIDWNNPLSKELRGAFLLNEGAGTGSFNIASAPRPVGVLSSGVKYIGGMEGDGGAKFDGTANAIIKYGNDAYYNPAALTIAGWVYATAWTNTYNTLISRKDSGGLNYYSIYITSTGRLALYTRNNGTNVVAYDGTGIFILAVNKWYHVALTYDSVNGLKGYVNGKLDGSVGAIGAFTPFVANLCVGGDDITSLRNLSGRVSDTWLWARTLNINEVQELYAKPYSLILPPGSRRWWQGFTTGTSVNIVAACPNMSLATNAPTLSIGNNIVPSVPNVNLNTNTAILNIGNNLVSSTPNVNLNTNTPVLSIGNNLVSSTPNVNLNTNTPVLGIGRSLISSAPNVNLATNTFVLSIGLNLTSTTPNVLLATNSPALGGGTSVTSTTPNIVANTSTPILSIGRNIAAVSSDILLSTTPPTLRIDVTIIPPSPDVLLQVGRPIIGTGLTVVTLLDIAGNIAQLLSSGDVNIKTILLQKRTTDDFTGLRTKDNYAGVRNSDKFTGTRQ